MLDNHSVFVTLSLAFSRNRLEESLKRHPPPPSGGADDDDDDVVSKTPVTSLTTEEKAEEGKVR